ncbi:MAG: toxin-antitoxin system HicB family antitoxin [Terracidiphilus sp.]
MRTSNFALRLQPTLMDEAKALAKAEGVALNQLINVAVAEKLAVTRTLEFFANYTRDADVAGARKLLAKARPDNPPMKGDELPASWKKRRAGAGGGRRAPAATRSK